MPAYDEAKTKCMRAFVEEAKRLSFTPPNNSFGAVKPVVSLDNVKKLIRNLINDKPPDYIQPPSWYHKDCVGYLIKRGWEIDPTKTFLVRRDWAISEGTIHKYGSFAPKKAADMIERQSVLIEDLIKE